MKKNQPAKPKVLYEELTPGEFRERMAVAPIAYLPLGTIEWHGEHMPLGSDGIQPFEFFREVAAEVGGIVLPALFQSAMVHRRKKHYVRLQFFILLTQFIKIQVKTDDASHTSEIALENRGL